MTERIDAKDYAKVVRKKSWSNARHVKTTDGTFDSKGEHERWKELKLLEKSRAIHSLEHHQKFPLEVNEVLIKNYRADFCYYDVKAEKWIIEDFKGRKFREWALTKKLITALYPDYLVIETQK